MDEQKSLIPLYLKGALVVIVAFFSGFFLSRYLDMQEVSRGSKVQLIGVFQKMDVLEKALQSVEEIVGRDSRLIVEEQVRGPIENQYMVSVNGTLAPVEQPLLEYGYIITVDDGEGNPFATSVIEGKVPDQYYVLVRENVDGEFDISTYKLHD